LVRGECLIPIPDTLQGKAMLTRSRNNVRTAGDGAVTKFIPAGTKALAVRWCGAYDESHRRMTQLRSIMPDTWRLCPPACHGGPMHIDERQRRSDEPTANAVARGLNILAVRDAELARRYMEHKEVPTHVISRVLDDPESRRRESAAQSVSEAITPSATDEQ
jgi:hypothetical protein